jgi:hypothetical protein
LTTPSVDDTPIHEDFDFELLGGFDAACLQGLATMWAGSLLLGQIQGLLPKGQVAVIASSRSVLIRVPPASTFGLVVSGVFQVIGAVAAGLLFGAASVAFGLQFANLASKLSVFLLQRHDPLHGVGMPAPPVTGLLSQLEILAPQVANLGA